MALDNEKHYWKIVRLISTRDYTEINREETFLEGEKSINFKYIAAANDEENISSCKIIVLVKWKCQCDGTRNKE